MPLPLPPQPPFRPSRLRAGVFLAVVSTAVLVFALADHPDADPPLMLAAVRLPNGSPLILAVARTPTQRARGLSERDRPEADGLLLLWPDAGRRPVWMRGMRFSLDLLWCDADGRVLAIKTHVVPCPASGECPLHGAMLPNVRAVLELPAGHAAPRGLRVHDRITIPVLALP